MSSAPDALPPGKPRRTRRLPAPGVRSLWFLVASMVGALTVVVVSLDASRAREELQRDLQNEALQLASRSAGTLGQVGREAGSYLSRAAVRLRTGGTEAFCSDLRDSFMEHAPSYFANAGLVRLSGGLACDARGVPPELVEGTATWLHGLQPGEERQGDVFFGPASGQWLYGWGRGVELGGEHLAVVLWIGLSSVSEMVTPLSPDPEVLQTVTAPGDVILMRSLDPESWVGKRLPERAANDRSPVLSDLGGVERAWESMEVPATGWSVKVGIATRTIAPAVAATRSASLRRSALWALIASLPLLVIAWMAQAVRDLHASVRGEGGRDPASIPVAGPQETRELGCAFREAFRKVSESATALADVNRNLEKQVQIRSGELREKARALETANQALSEALTAKDGFLRLVSHELRTPLTGILVQSQALLDGVYGELTDRQEVAAERIEECGTGLHDLVDRILDMAYLQGPSTWLEHAEVPVGDLVAEAVDSCSDALSARDQSVEVVGDGSPRLLVDRGRIRDALAHLVRNAGRHSEPGARVEVSMSASEDGRTVHLRVRDDGEGIPPEKLHQIFEPFAQIHSGLNRPHGGIGLGLPFVRRVAELHGGRVTVTSEPGVGSVFTLILPTSHDSL